MEKLTHHCEVCAKEISGNRGSLFVHTGDVLRAQAALPRDRGQGAGGSPQEIGELVRNWEENVARWHVMCDACMADAGIWEGIREIGLHQLTTYGHLVAWTAHLMEKRWLEVTNWRQVLASYASGLMPEADLETDAP